MCAEESYGDCMWSKPRPTEAATMAAAETTLLDFGKYGIFAEVTRTVFNIDS